MFSVPENSAARNCAAIELTAVQTIITPAHIQQIVATYGYRFPRQRKIVLSWMLWLLIGRHLVASASLPRAVQQLTQGTRLREGDPALPTGSSLVYRRQQLGGDPLQALFRLVCHPRATPATPGAFRFGYRLMALDGSIDNLPATASLCRRYAAKQSQRGKSAYPQVLGVYLVECGTHLVCDAGFWPGTTSEHIAVRRLLRSVERGMLLLWDRGFHSYALIQAVRQRGAHVIGRLPAHVHPRFQRALSDGSYLATLSPPSPADAPLLVRVVTYRVLGRAPIRLVTTLLNPVRIPARDLAATYHERWESELVFDELGTHLELGQQTLRSQTCYGVIQDLYGMLLAHYAIRSLMLASAQSQSCDPDRLSFTQALALVHDSIVEFPLLPDSCAAFLLHRLVRQIGQAVLPPRRVRSTPRTVRRSRSKFKQRQASTPPGLSWPGASADYLDLLPIPA